MIHRFDGISACPNVVDAVARGGFSARAGRYHFAPPLFRRLRGSRPGRRA